MSKKPLVTQSSISPQKYKYHCFYRADTGELYAYTDDKVYAKIFRKTRDMGIFIYQEKMLTSLDLKDIHDEVPDALITIYTFDLSNNELYFPITLREKLTVEHTVQQTITASIYCATAGVPIEIFTKKIQKHLNILGYKDIYEEYSSGWSKDLSNIKPDYLKCFLTLFGDTMKLIGGDENK